MAMLHSLIYQSLLTYKSRISICIEIIIRDFDCLFIMVKTKKSNMKKDT